MINVTRPFLPPLEEYESLVRQIWDRAWLTNNGPFVIELERQLRDYLRLENLLFLGNGTIAIQIAIKSLDLKGEIITTPFSYVATTSTILWENCHPVFVDIDKASLNIDPKKIEDAITDETSAILATHVYGNPCEVDAINEIAEKHDLKVIYDAAHCFGTKYKGKSILSYGDISTISFHATKLFHTTEGGAIICRDDEINLRLEKLRNFGHDGPAKFAAVGINGKNSELHAAMGLVNLRYIDEILDRRKKQYLRYQDCLMDTSLDFITITDNTEFNYAYCPVIFESEEHLIETEKVLNEHQINPRRYFFPSLNKLEYLQENQYCPIAESVSPRIMCLPVYHDLENKDIDRICSLINKVLN